MSCKPLVTVIVITYNSAKYVIDTLESIKRQNYDNIQLVISDDCSKDETFKICSDWIKINNSFSGGATICSTNINKGISGNYNNGLKFANGKYVKYIAGDDMLTDDCLSAFVEAAEKSTDKIFICGTLPFVNSGQALTPRLLPTEYFIGDAKAQESLIVKKGTIIEAQQYFWREKLYFHWGDLMKSTPSSRIILYI